MNNETMVCNSCGDGNKCCGNNCGGGNCGEGHGGGHHRHFLLRLIIGIVILMIVFSLGVKIGEFKGMYGDAYGDHWMMRQQQYQPRYMMLDQRTAPVDSGVPLQQ